MIVLHYALTGVRPQLGRIGPGPRTERTAERAARFLYPLTRALGPLPRLLVAMGNALPPRRRMRNADGSEPGPIGRPVARSELRGLVDYLERRTGIEPGEREMVRSVFELGDTIVREVMVPRTDMVFIESDKTVEQALSLALRSGFSRIPVVGENTDNVVGIAYLKDIVAWSHDHPGAESSEKVATVMRPASYVPDSKPVDELLRQMQAQRNHVAIVIDEYGGTAGLVTIEDILEEIVGEITDEYDNERPPVEWLSDGSARVTARLPVTELEELFGVRVERRGRGDGGRAAGPQARPGAHRGLDRDRQRPAADRGEPGRPPQQDRNRPGAAVEDDESAVTPRGLRHGELVTELVWRGAARHQIDTEDLKIITLARSTRARVAASEGAAVRDETGRTYAAAAVALPSLRLVRAAPGGGHGRIQRRAEARGGGPGQRGRAGPRRPRRGARLGPDATVFHAAPDGTLRPTLTT